VEKGVGSVTWLYMPWWENDSPYIPILQQRRYTFNTGPREG